VVRAARLCSALKKSRCGAVAAEFALIFPVLFSLLMGGFEYGFVAYSMSSLQFGANVVARDVAVNNLDRAAAEEALDAFLPPWMDGDVSMIMTEDNPGDPRLNSVTIELQADSTTATPLSLITRAYPITLSASATVRQELPYVD
jgi:Flp pilus assembly protein TadG